MERVSLELLNKTSDEYRAEGFLLVKNAIPMQDINNLHIAIQKVFIQQLQYLEIKLRLDSESIFQNTRICLETLFKADLDRYLASLRLCAKFSDLYQIYTSKTMLKIVQSLGIDNVVFQTQPVFHVMSENLKIENGYFGVGAHQDWPALQSGLDTLTVWCPLVPVKKNGYTLEVIPKSHLLGYCESEEKKHYHEVSSSSYAHLPSISVEANPGDVLFFSSFLIHKSELQGEPDAFRIAYSMRYENFADPNFIGRAYPFAQKRVVERTLKAEDIPSREEVTRIFAKT